MKLSVILNTYNRAELLDRGLYSIFDQDFPKKDYEVIVVDDSSMDNTQEIIMKYMKEVPNLRYFYRDKGVDQKYYTNAGFCANIGIKQAKGDIILRCDAEIIHENESLKKHSEVHALDENIICFSELYNIPYESSVMNCIDQLPWKGNAHFFLAHRSELEPYTGLTIQRPLVFLASIRRKHYLSMRGYDEDFKTYGCEDNDFADRLIKMGVSYIYLDSRMLEKNAYTGPNMLDERYEPYCCLGFHQGHRRWEDSPRYESSYETLKRKVDQWQKGKIGYKRNLGREWGVLHNGFTIYNNEGTTVKRTIRNDLEVV